MIDAHLVTIFLWQSQSICFYNAWRPVNLTLAFKGNAIKEHENLFNTYD